MGHQVTMAANGAEAVEAYRHGDFDLVLMDVQMPVMDGFQATQRIRDIERTRDRYTPIIAMTARAMKGDEEHCLRIGMDAYMAKPFRATKLAEILQEILPGLAANMESDSAARSTQPPAAGPYDLRVILATLNADDAEDLQLAADVYLKHFAAEITGLEEAWEKRALEQLHKNAHRIKGGVGSLRAFHAQHLAQEIEAAAGRGDADLAGRLLPELITELRHVAENIRLVRGAAK
jgi:CheY-like chemotaxis protein